jgi:hypothetical protein
MVVDEITLSSSKPVDSISSDRATKDKTFESFNLMSVVIATELVESKNNDSNYVLNYKEYTADKKKQQYLKVVSEMLGDMNPETIIKKNGKGKIKDWLKGKTEDIDDPVKKALAYVDKQLKGDYVKKNPQSGADLLEIKSYLIDEVRNGSEKNAVKAQLACDGKVKANNKAVKDENKMANRIKKINDEKSSLDKKYAKEKAKCHGWAALYRSFEVVGVGIADKFFDGCSDISLACLTDKSYKKEKKHDDKVIAKLTNAKKELGKMQGNYNDSLDTLKSTDSKKADSDMSVQQSRMDSLADEGKSAMSFISDYMTH